MVPQGVEVTDSLELPCQMLERDLTSSAITMQLSNHGTVQPGMNQFSQELALHTLFSPLQSWSCKSTFVWILKPFQGIDCSQNALGFSCWLEEKHSKDVNDHFLTMNIISPEFLLSAGCHPESLISADVRNPLISDILFHPVVLGPLVAFILQANDQISLSSDLHLQSLGTQGFSVLFLCTAH